MRLFIILGLLTLALAIIIGLSSSLKQARWATSHPAVGKFVEVDGKQIHYVKEGSGPALILLHGAGGNLRDFTFDLIRPLAKTHTVYAFDRPGHGYSDIYDPKGESLTEQARIITKAAQSLGVENATVLGYSFGGSVGMTMALEYPDFTDCLLLVAAPIHTWPDDSVSATYRMAALPVIGPAIMNAAFAILPDSYFANSYAGVFTPQSPPAGYLDHVGVGLTVNPKSFVANSRQIVPLADQIRDMIPRYNTLTLPIEIIHGTADESVSSKFHTGDFMAMQERPNANATYVDGMGHGIHQLEQMEIINALKRLSKSP